MTVRLSPAWCALFALALAAPAHAATIDGNLDSLTTATATGWSCVPSSSQPGTAALYAGIHRIGIFPNATDRPDTSSVCGPGIIQNGFRIGITPALTQQLAFQPNLSLYALNPGAPAILLRPSHPLVRDPFPLPTGLIASLTPDGALTGLIANAPPGLGPATVAIVAGGPAGAGGTLLGNATLKPNAQAPRSFTFAAPGLAGVLASPPPGYALPVYAYVSNGTGPDVQLGSPAILGAAYLPLAAQVTQAGAQSGITSTLFTAWVPPSLDLRGVTGSLTFRGNSNSFSQAQITIGTTTDSQLACKLRNRTSPPTLPAIASLAAFTLRANDTAPDTIPIDIALPYAMPLPAPAGTCLITAITAGYLFLDATSAKYTATAANIAAILSPAAADAPIRFAETLGTNYHFASGAESNLYTIAAIRLRAPTQLDAIGAALSVSGITGASEASGWLPTPVGNWTATASFYAFPAADCAALGIAFISQTANYDTGSIKTPTNTVIPPSAVLLFDMPLYGNGATATQQTFFQTFPVATQPGTSRITFAPGDCLVALHNIAAAGNTLYGNLNLANQSTAYFHIDSTQPN